MDKFKDILKGKMDFGPPITNNHDDIWASMEARIDKLEGQRRKRKWFYAYAVAASIALVLMIGMLLLPKTTKSVLAHKSTSKSNRDTITLSETQKVYNKRSTLEKKIVVTKELSRPDIKVPSFVKNKGYKSFTATMPEYLELPDHTMTVLNKDAQVLYNETYLSHREVRLEGDAYFEVVHHPDLAFTVYFANTHLIVLGTKFYISGSAHDSIQIVTVVEGSVKVYDSYSHHYKVLTKGQELVLKQNSKAESRTADSETLGLWKKGALVFDKTKLKKVFYALNNEHGAKIKYDEKISECIFTGNLSGMVLKDALNLIRITTNLVVEQKDGQIFVTGNKCD